jgi:hypothetical protein
MSEHDGKDLRRNAQATGPRFPKLVAGKTALPASGISPVPTGGCRGCCSSMVGVASMVDGNWAQEADPNEGLDSECWDR